MAVHTIYLARHGFRLSWETREWASPTGVPRDPPLSAHGVDQAKELASWFARLPEEQRPQAVVSSPLYRCLQTAAPTARALGLPLLVEHGLGEWYLPVRRGLHPTSPSADELQRHFPDVIAPEEHSTVLVPSNKGESTEQVHTRAGQAIEALVHALEERREDLERIVCFTHAATNIAIARALIGEREADVRSGTCSVGKYTTARREKGAGLLGKCTQKMNGDCSMLSKGEERHWDFSYVEEYEEDGILEDGTEAGPLASDRYKPQL